MVERVVLVSPRGFCAGVVRAIAAVEQALATFGPPVYVRRAIVHNARVVERLRAAGATFVQELDEVPRGAIVVLSAHGVAASVRDEASRRELRVVDATCPLVAKVHREVRRFSRRGYDVVLLGHAGHDEVAGTLGQAPDVRLVEAVSDVARLDFADPERVACVAQTTLSPMELACAINELRQRFPGLVQPAASDVCFATRNRQAAVAWLGRNVDVVLVVGDPTSSNSRRLCEVAHAAGAPAHLLSGIRDLDRRWLADTRVVGVSAGASTPEDAVAEVVAALCRDGAAIEREEFVAERVSFGLPPQLTARRNATRGVDWASPGPLLPWPAPTWLPERPPAATGVEVTAPCRGSPGESSRLIIARA